MLRALLDLTGNVLKLCKLSIVFLRFSEILNIILAVRLTVLELNVRAGFDKLASLFFAVRLGTRILCVVNRNVAVFLGKITINNVAFRDGSAIVVCNFVPLGNVSVIFLYNLTKLLLVCSCRLFIVCNGSIAVGSRIAFNKLYLSRQGLHKLGLVTVLLVLFAHCMSGVKNFAKTSVVSLCLL